MITEKYLPEVRTSPYVKLYAFVLRNFAVFANDSLEQSLQELLNKIDAAVIQPLFENAALWNACHACITYRIDDSEHTAFMELWPKIASGLQAILQGEPCLSSVDVVLARMTFKTIAYIYSDAASNFFKINIPFPNLNTIRMAVTAIQYDWAVKELRNAIILELTEDDPRELNTEKMEAIVAFSILFGAHLVKVSSIQESVQTVNERHSLLTSALVTAKQEKYTTLGQRL